jgi:membrane fusion protein (multidrug efflux system)
MILADGSTYEHTGMATKIDRNIDPTTGALTVEADFPNPDNLLRPGMFARIRFSAAEIPDAILVPQRAVAELQSDYRIYVINPDNTIDIRQVEVGQRLGSNWIIESGIEPGDRVAVEGLLRLQSGMTVNARPAEQGDLPPNDAEAL